MNKNYAIAYTDKNGNGFSESTPWIMDDFGGDLEGCLQKANEMRANGYQKVIPFQFGKEQEEYSWEYVNSHRVLKK